MSKGNKWIQAAVNPKNEGSLRKTLGAKAGQPILAAKLEKAAGQGGVTGQRARLAQTLRKIGKNK